LQVTDQQASSRRQQQAGWTPMTELLGSYIPIAIFIGLRS
jgi:hypothetical protein